MTQHDRRVAGVAFHARKAVPGQTGWKLGLLRFDVFLMKAVRQAIEERTAEIGDGDLQVLFSRKIPAKGFSPKWLEKNLAKHGAGLLSPEGWLRGIPKMAGGRYPALTTVGELAAHLNLAVEELEWFADLKERNPGEGRLGHYRYRWIPKRKGGRRLLMEPKESLKMTQRRILDSILHQGPDVGLREILRGRIAAIQMLNAKRGEKLRGLFYQVDWK